MTILERLSIFLTPLVELLIENAVPIINDFLQFKIIDTRILDALIVYVLK